MKEVKKRIPAKQGKKQVRTLVKRTGLPKKVSIGIAAVAAVDPQALLARAIDKNLPIENMERLLAMRREMKAEWAKEEFFKALAGFQHECPIITKEKKVRAKKKADEKEASTKYVYAPIEDLVAGVKEFLEKWGFSYTFKGKQENGFYTAICVAHHKAGHSEETQFTVPTFFPEYMNMSGPQMQGAACTYADRYAFKNAFGIVTKGEDTDAQAPEEEPKKRTPIQEPKAKEAAVPVQHEVVKPLSDFEKVQKYLQATEVDPKTKLTVKIFSENEVIDYTFEAKEAQGKPEQMKIIMDDIIKTGGKRRRAIKGEVT